VTVPEAQAVPADFGRDCLLVLVNGVSGCAFAKASVMIWWWSNASRCGCSSTSASGHQSGVQLIVRLREGVLGGDRLPTRWQNSIRCGSHACGVSRNDAGSAYRRLPGTNTSSVDAA
jgi:hypothetical protein